MSGAAMGGASGTTPGGEGIGGAEAQPGRGGSGVAGTVGSDIAGSSESGVAGSSESGVAGSSGSDGGPNTGGSSEVTAGCGMDSWPTTNDESGSTPYTLTINGTEREYYVSVPASYDSSQATRVVFAWHWRGGNARNITGNGAFGGAYYGLIVDGHLKPQKSEQPGATA
jgi:hypothetical protein